MEIKIDPEFRDIIPALTNAEYEQLEKNLINEGCRERIITWDNYLIDGHNRYDICTKHDLSFEILELNHFEDRHEVIDWMIQNQIGKRNLTGGTISYLRGLKLKRAKLRKLEEVKPEEETLADLPVSNEESADTDTPSDSAEELPVKETSKAKDKSTLTIIREHEEAIAKDVADMYQISPSTLKKDEKFADAIDTIRENVGRKIQDKILNKELKLNPVEVVKISKMESEEQKELMSGEDEEILERLAEVKREKQELNHKNTMIKLDQKLASLNHVNISGTFVLESDEEQVYLIHKDEKEQENLICNFKGTAKVDNYLEGFIAAATLLSSDSESDPEEYTDESDLDADFDDYKADTELNTDDIQDEDTEVKTGSDDIQDEDTEVKTGSDDIQDEDTELKTGSDEIENISDLEDE